MKNKWRMLLSPYQVALNRYLKQGSAASVRSALLLGRRAVVLGLETLDLALIHEQALIAQVLSSDARSSRHIVIQRARAFFAEAIIPMEETHRSALETNRRLGRLNLGLNKRTLDLADSNRELKKEISRRKVVEETLRKSEQQANVILKQSRCLQEQLQFLSRRILSVQEEERKRISRELHDVIAQMLTGINVRLATLKMDATSHTKGLGLNISRTQRLIEKSVDIVHRFARELRPAVLDDLGLIPALNSFMKRFAKETGIRASLTAFAKLEELDSDKRTVLYRVAQEALTNVARHARASQVAVSIQRLPDAVCMIIKDDGKSFKVNQMWHSIKSQHFGLLGMRERVEMVGGKFTIESSPGHGTAIQARIPFNNRARGNTRR